MNDPMKVTINLERAISDLVEDINNSEFEKSSILKSKLALSLTLISMSIRSIPRLMELFNFSQKAEERIFNEDRLSESTSLDDMLELYKISTERQNNTITFISTILNNIKWHDLENALLTLDEITNREKDKSTRAVNKGAKEVLSIIEDLKRNKELNISALQPA